MRIAVISDTHDRLPDSVRDGVAGADQIWHLGDVCAPVLLESLIALGVPLKVVRGNCDSGNQWPMTCDLEIEEFFIRLIHIPPRAAPAHFDLLLHGHTHVPRNEVVGGARFLNPGCITRPNRGAPASYAWLELRRGAAPQWTLVRV